MGFLFYLLKVSLLLGLFGTSYKVLLSRETFFSYNRVFLLSGIGISVLLPLCVFTNTVYVTTNSDFTFANITESLSALPEVSQPEAVFDWVSLLLSLYFFSAIAIITYFFWQLVKVYAYLKKRSSYKLNGIKYIETKEDLAPFSFLNNIVYNPKAHTAEELSFILKHEETHARQSHTIDLLLTKCCCALLWFNPLAWWYSQLVEQNLELIADAEASSTVPIKQYQLALVKQATGNAVPNLTQSFYKSFLKTRIMMLSKPTSQKQNRLKVICLLPFLALFLWSFNIKEERISRTAEIKTTSHPSFILDQHSTEGEIRTLEDYFIENVPELDIAISGINRDLAGNISMFHFMTKYEGDTQFQERFLRKGEGDFVPYEIQYLGDGLLRITEQGEQGNTFVLSRNNLQIKENKFFSTESGMTRSKVSEGKRVQKSKKTPIQQDQTFQYEIKPNTTETELEQFAEKMERVHRIRLSYSGLQHNQEGILTSISLIMKDLRSRSTSNLNLSNTEGLGTIVVFKNEDGGIGFTSSKRSNAAQYTSTTGTSRYRSVQGDSSSTSLTGGQKEQAEAFVRQARSNQDSISKKYLAIARQRNLEKREEALELREQKLEERSKLIEERLEERKKSIEERTKEIESTTEERMLRLDRKSDANSEEIESLYSLNEDYDTRRKTLYIVDDEVVDDPDFDLSDINPETIESIYIFKGKEEMKQFVDDAEGKDNAIVIKIKPTNTEE